KLRQGLFDSVQVLPVAIAAAGGFLYTALRIDWFAGDLLHMDGENPDALWLSDGAGPLLPIGAAEGKATPARAVLGT
ncbi:hypothetical protein ACSTIN_22810, partial [Vibrio parahaemolyticus]